MRVNIDLPETVQRAVAALWAVGARPYLVGGAVRDALRGAPASDLDFEVYGIGAAQLAAALQPCGRVEAVGASFGVTKLWTADGHAVDFALPRREARVGAGHRDFAVTVDPTMAPAEACRRRDFTWNALLWDPHTREVRDFVWGVADLDARVIRHVSDRFAEDPLRPLRAVQFAARFGMRVAPATAAVCRAMRDQEAALSRDRVWGEWRKWARAPRPGMGLRALADIGWRACYPEVDRLAGVPQNPRHHPEGDALAHTVLVVQAAAQIAARDGLDAAAREELVFAALLHDVGKADTTVVDAGRVTAHGHDERSAELCVPFAARIGMPIAVRERVVRLVREHMAHVGVRTPSKRVVRRLAERLHPVTIADLARLGQADAWGRGGVGNGNPFKDFLLIAEAIDVGDRKPEPILKGRHLLARGVAPWPGMGAILRAAFEAQLDGAFEDEAGAVTWAAEHGEG